MNSSDLKLTKDIQVEFRLKDFLDIIQSWDYKQVLQFILLIDEEIGDWNFTMMLYVYLKKLADEDGSLLDEKGNPII